MHVLYEEEGGFKVGSVLAEMPASLHVESVQGKRSKVKSAHVLLRFEQPAPAVLLEQATALAQSLDADFLWEAAGTDEFGFEALARDYFGHAPEPVESAAMLLRLHAAPMYFYRRGRGLYRPAPAEALKAALAGAEKKRREAEQQAQYAAQLVHGVLPGELRPLVASLLYAPDRKSVAWRALEQAVEESGLPAPKLLARCGALASPEDYHYGRFLFEHFPHGTGHPAAAVAAAPGELPLAPVEACSIDDAETTEIDDAFSVERRGDGWRIGVHIAAPSLGIEPGSPLDAAARARLSTAYFPGRKITMLPEAAIDAYTLAAGRDCPALSLYADFAADGSLAGTETRVERVRIAVNLRHDELDALLVEAALESGAIDHPRGAELALLYRLARRLEAGRAKPEQQQRVEYSFSVRDGRVTIRPRLRGAPLDRLVSEWMIFANWQWGAALADSGQLGIYRAQGAGKVYMTTVPAAHEGLGVSHYAWATSPLRRYVDLVNQRQLVALAHGQPPCYPAGSEEVLAAMRDFELAHDAYAEAQRTLERYWSLCWLEQQGVTRIGAEVVRESLARIDGAPLVVRVPSMPESLRWGTRVELELERVDLWALEAHFRYRTEISAAPEGR
jgi:exoribonuclease-2